MRLLKTIASVFCLVLLSSGCATSNQPCCGQAVALRDIHPRNLIVLHDEMALLRKEFNAHSARWRVFSLVSPTCSECVLGAEAVEKEITRRYPKERVASLVVWIPMLESDNEAAARSAATIFPPDRCVQFFDAQQAVGLAYAGRTFAGFIERARQTIPKEHPLADALADRGEAERPQWDLYMIYAPGVQWESAADGPPQPNHWIRHCGRTDGQLSTYWRDTPDKPPSEGNLFDAIREMAEQAIGLPASASRDRPTKIELLGFKDCPHTAAMQASIQTAIAKLGLHATIEYVDQERLPDNDLRRCWPAPTILVNGSDLFGMKRTSSPAIGCRVYAGGLPGVEAIRQRLAALSSG